METFSIHVEALRGIARGKLLGATIGAEPGGCLNPLDLGPIVKRMAVLGVELGEGDGNRLGAREIGDTGFS